jgi:hypothetical protein
MNKPLKKFVPFVTLLMKNYSNYELIFAVERTIKYIAHSTFFWTKKSF